MGRPAIRSDITKDRATAVCGPRVLRPKRAADYCGLSLGHVWRLAASGVFPAPIKLGPNATAFVVAELDRWIDERIAARDG